MPDMRVILVFLLFILPSIAQKRPITHEDVWQMKRVGAPVVSPDGKWAVTSVAEPSYDPAQAVSDLWLIALDRKAPPRRLTNTKGSESGAVFSPDSKRLAFSAKREGDDDSQIYILPMDGGEAVRVTKISTGASDPQWRPDGKAILFESRVYPGARTDEDNKKIAAERKARKYNMRVYDSFPVRYWDHWLDDLRPHVWVQNLEGDTTPRDLLAGTKLASSKGFEGETQSTGTALGAIWSPDGASIVFTATSDSNSVAGPSVTHLFRIAASGGEPVAITSGKDNYHNPVFRPDGKALYATVQRYPALILYSQDRLVKFDWPQTAQAKPMTDSWDRAVESVAFSPDSRIIYITAEDQGHDRLFQMPAEGGELRLAFPQKDGGYAGVAIASRAASLVMVAEWQSMVHPADIVRVDVKTGSNSFLTEFHKKALAELDLPAPRDFWFTSKAGKRIHSWVILPPAFDASKKYPLVLFPHGGPNNMTKDMFFVRWNYHLLTTPGYVLLMTNYTGSTGYGEEFAAAIHKDILRGPSAEIEQAADEAIRMYPFIDGSKQAGVGASYGGYLMNWFEGNSKRFKCLVNHAGLTDNSSFYGATDDAYYWEVRNGGPVWEQKKAWHDESPAAYAANFSTPMLITQGEQDFRVPYNQALEMYKLLQRRGVPSRLVMFPDHNHWILKGEDGRQHMREVLDWLKRYL